MSLKICNTCGLKKDKFQLIENNTKKICIQCYDKLQDKNDIRTIPIKLPEGLIAAWNGKAAYLNKKLGRRYFYIPENQSSNILDEIEYKIIIREVEI